MSFGRFRRRFALALLAGVIIFIPAYIFMPALAKTAKNPSVKAFVATAPDITQTSSTTSINLQELLDLTNQERSMVGQPPLIADAGLYKSSDAKCHDMKANNYFEHISPSGKNGLSFIEEAYPGYLKIGENLASGYNSATEVVAGWAQSPSHRKAMLSPDYSYVGFAACGTVDEYGRPLLLIVQHLLETAQ